MKIAVPYDVDNQTIVSHFAEAANFKIYTVDGGHIIDDAIVPLTAKGHDAIAGFLWDYRVSAVICGHIGKPMRTALVECGIDIFAGIAGNPNKAVEALIKGTLEDDMTFHEADDAGADRSYHWNE